MLGYGVPIYGDKINIEKGKGVVYHADKKQCLALIAESIKQSGERIYSISLDANNQWRSTLLSLLPDCHEDKIGWYVF